MTIPLLHLPRSRASASLYKIAALALWLLIPRLCLGAGPPQVSRVEPPNWWTGYVSPVMALLTGENLNGANISTGYPGARISKVQVQPDGKHAFVWLTLAKSTKPGDLKLHLKTGSGETDATLPLAARAPQQGRFQGLSQDDVIYLVMPDRFADGDPANNMPPGAAPGTYDISGAKTYHGGDLKGLQQHLPYLKELGVTAIWTTPLYDNDNQTSDYHGYGAIDLYAVEDHFGTMMDYQSLVAAAHQQGMKVILDVVPNHVGPKHPWATSQPAPGWLHGTAENHVENTYDFPPVTDPHAVPANYRNALEGWFANVLPDIAQENPLAAQYLLDNAYWWIESSGLDAFRIDTFPYVPRSFWAYYDKALLATYPHFFLFGEVNNQDATAISYFAGGQVGFDGIDTQLTTEFDFPMNSAIRSVVNHGAPARRIVDVLRMDRLYPHPELLVTFIGNHDQKRFLTDADGSRDKLKLALALQLTMRGIPQLYYGDEIGMAGGEDPDNRHDFPGGFPGDQHSAFTAVGRTPQEQDLYADVQSLLKLRRDHVALRRGSQKHVAVADKYYAFTREAEGERLLVVFHNSDAAEPLVLDLAGTSIADAKSLTPLFGGSAAKVGSGQITVQAAPLSVSVYRLE